MKQKYILILVVALILLTNGFFLWRTFKASPKPHYAVRMNTVLAKEVDVTISDTGFLPKTVTIKPGTAVRWKNTTSKPQAVNSDNYPTNKLHKELNFGEFNAGSSVQYIFTKPGTYGYHNQLHPEQVGTVIVTQ